MDTPGKHDATRRCQAVRLSSDDPSRISDSIRLERVQNRAPATENSLPALGAREQPKSRGRAHSNCSSLGNLLDYKYQQILDYSFCNPWPETSMCHLSYEH